MTEWRPELSLKNYQPMYIGITENLNSGTRVDPEHWNELWASHQQQGDYQTETLVTLLDALNESVWHPLNGAISIKKQPLNDGHVTSLDNVSSQIDFIFDRLVPLLPLSEENGAEGLENVDFSEVQVSGTSVSEQLEYLLAGLNVLYDTFPMEHNDLPDRGAPNAHPIESISGLEERLLAIQTGQVSIYHHNLFPGRSAEGSHPISAITGLAEQVAKNQSHQNMTSGVAHPAQVIRGTDSNGMQQNLQVLLNSIYATLKAATGFSAINHNDLLGRTMAASHPIAAITDLQTALDARYTKAAADAKFQPKVLWGTGTPPVGTYPDGTLYLRIYE